VTPRAHLLTAGAFALAAFIALSGCKAKNKTKDDPRVVATDAAASRIATIDAPPPPPDRVEITLDDELVTTIAASDLDERKPVDTIVSADATTWLLVEATGPNGRYTSLYKPHEKHPGARVYVYTDARGIPAFGLFEDGAEHPKILERRINRINVATRTPDRKEAAPKGHFTLAAGKAPPQVVDDAMLEPLPEATPPGGEADGRGWYLRDIIGLVDSKNAKTVHIEVGDGEPADIEISRINDDTFATYLKRNRRGQWRLKTWSVLPDGSHKLIHSLRGITAIELR
jgi:hypothetical protein